MQNSQPKAVFISYKTEEFDDANWVRATLENNGISCWMAPMCIPGGSSYAVEIPNAIKQCTVFVLILSEKSQLSKWVPRELDQAINEDIGDTKNLILDLHDLKYISSAGLRVILGAQKKMHKIGTLKLINVCEEIMDIFEMTGFADILVIE